MRLKEDSDNWRSSGLKRRNFRQEKGDPEVAKGANTKKKTSKWCKGREGIEHQLRDHSRPMFGGAVFFHEWICTGCNKRFRRKQIDRILEASRKQQQVVLVRTNCSDPEHKSEYLRSKSTTRWPCSRCRLKDLSYGYSEKYVRRISDWSVESEI